jgi:hypothetical protein
MNRSSPENDGGFRAPQFALRDRSKADRSEASSAAAELADLFTKAPQCVSSGPAVSVTVRRKRMLGVQLPAGAVATETQSPRGDPEPDAAGHRGRQPRVFVVRQPAFSEASAVNDHAVVPSGAGGVDAEEQEARLARRASTSPQRRGRHAPDFKRPSPVAVSRPERHEPPEQTAEARDPSLAALQTDLEAVSRTLDGMRGAPLRWELDLAINDRWSKIDSALECVRSSLTPAARARRGG